MDVFLDGKRVCLAAKKLGAAPGLMTLGVTFRLRRKRVAWWSCYGSIVLRIDRVECGREHQSRLETYDEVLLDSAIC